MTLQFEGNTLFVEAARRAPMGAHVLDDGVNFSLWSDHATAVWLCLRPRDASAAELRIALHHAGAGVWSVFVRGLRAGAHYGYRVDGPHEPGQGHFFRPEKLLLDPYARAIVGEHRWHLAHSVDSPEDSGPVSLLAEVVAPLAPLSRPALHADQHVVLYEMHVKGFSRLHPAVPERLRGTYAGLAHPAAIAHLRQIGVTTVSLLPVQFHLDEPFLAQAGRSNYWGYNTLGFFAPDPRLSSTPNDPVATLHEFRAMTSALHAAGLEVVLDVVYNHTPEGGDQGSILSFRGIDNASWYALEDAQPRHGRNYTACGNTLNVSHPRVTAFVLDSLRYWVEVLGVDGFRFDLATVLGRCQRDHHRYRKDAAFFTAIAQDPVLSRVRLIAEPWDCGPDGYRAGDFPAPFADWNDKFRDDVRRFWLGLPMTRAQLARRLTASHEMFAATRRPPSASINYIAVHDGFTVADMVSYAEKHNHDNGEDNRDGRGDEPCNPFGDEGPTSDQAVIATRERVVRAMLATLYVSQGVPMLVAGAELGHSQRGNNNPYCQDNDLTWLDWNSADAALIAFVGTLARLRRDEPLLCWPDWFSGHGDDGGPRGGWFNECGERMQTPEWHRDDREPCARLLQLWLSHGERQILILFNAHAEPCSVRLCDVGVSAWRVVLDSTTATGVPAVAVNPISNRQLQLPAHSLLVLTPDSQS